MLQFEYVICQLRYLMIGNDSAMTKCITKASVAQWIERWIHRSRVRSPPEKNPSVPVDKGYLSEATRVQFPVWGKFLFNIFSKMPLYFLLNRKKLPHAGNRTRAAKPRRVGILTTRPHGFLIILFLDTRFIFVI